MRLFESAISPHTTVACRRRMGPEAIENLSAAFTGMAATQTPVGHV